MQECPEERADKSCLSQAPLGSWMLCLQFILSGSHLCKGHPRISVPLCCSQGNRLYTDWKCSYWPSNSELVVPFCQGRWRDASPLSKHLKSLLDTFCDSEFPNNFKTWSWNCGGELCQGARVLFWLLARCPFLCLHPKEMGSCICPELQGLAAHV